MADIMDLFGPPKSSAIVYPGSVTLTGITCTHTHPRDGLDDGDGRAELFVPYIDRVYEDAFGIGNTKRPLTSTELALKQGAFWQSLVRPGVQCRIHPIPLITETSDADDLIAGLDSGRITALKMFLRAVSNAENGTDVDDLDAVLPLIKRVSDRRSYRNRKTRPVIKIHAERKFTLLGRRIPILDRERVAVERDIERILKEVPDVSLEVCHVSLASTIEAILYYRKEGYDITGEVGWQYVSSVLDDLFENGDGGTGVASHAVCVPVFKTLADRMAVDSAMLSGDPAFYYGPDEACHIDDPTKPGGVKITSRGIIIPGQTQIPEANISKVIERFVEAGRPLSDAQKFLSDNARQKYGLPAGTRRTVFELRPWTVPDEISCDWDGDAYVSCRVAMGGQECKYALMES